MDHRKTRGILLLAVLAGVTAAANCAHWPLSGPPWTQVPACFGNDLLAASVSRDDHRRWAEGQYPAALEATLQQKIDQLWQCPQLTDDLLYTGFADISVVIARYVPDPACFNGDVVVTGQDWQAHKNWAIQNGRQQALENLKWKTRAALSCLQPPAQLDFYADVSQAIARLPYGGMNAPPPVTYPVPQEPAPGPTPAPPPSTPPAPTPAPPPASAPTPTPAPAPAPAPSPTPAPAPAPAPTSAPAPATPGPTQGVEYGVDRPGSDLRNFEFEDGNVEQNASACAAACEKDQSCRAWTFVRPGAQGPKSRCWLKNAVPAPVPNAEYAISGVVRQEGAAAPTPGTASALPVTNPAGCKGFAGAWTDNVFGNLTLQQQGSRVTGIYTVKTGGKIEATVSGNALDGTWTHNDGLSGSVHLEVSADGRTYQGTATASGWQGNITGQCIGAPVG